MKRKLKLKPISVGIISAVTLPVFIVASCGATTSENKKIKDKDTTDSGTNKKGGNNQGGNTITPPKDDTSNNKGDTSKNAGDKTKPRVTNTTEHKKFSIPTSVDIHLLDDREQRGFSHVNFYPAHRFVHEGQKFTIKSNSDEEVKVILFLRGIYASIKNDKRDFKQYTIKPHETKEITAGFEAVIYFDAGGNSQPTNVELISENLIKIPFYTINKTTDDQFIDSLRKSTSPIAQITSDYYTFTWDRQKMIDLYNKLNKKNLFSEAIKRWDQVAEGYSFNRGLNTKYSGVAKKFKTRISLETTEKMKSGLFAFATPRFVQFPSSTGEDLMGGQIYDKWGILHEIGHMWQTTYLRPGIWSETSNNMMIVLFQKHLSKNKYNIFTTPGKKKVLQDMTDAMKANKAPSGKVFQGDPAMMMMEQLDSAFGKEFFPTLNQYYRTHYNTRHFKDDEMLSAFARVASKVTNRNLTPFFDKWKMPVDAASLKEIAQYPALKQEIWKNHLFGNAMDKPIVENIMPKYNPVFIDESTLPKVVDSTYGENQNDIINRIKSQINVPANYKMEVVVNKDKRQKDLKDYVSFNVYDPNNRWATENRFFIKLHKTKVPATTTIGVGDWWRHGMKNRLRLHFTKSINKLFFDGDLEHPLFDYANNNTTGPNAQIKVKVLNADNSIAKEVIFDSTKKIKEVIASDSLTKGIHMTEGMRVVIEHINYERFVFLLTDTNAGQDYKDANLSFVIKNGIFVKE